MKKLINQILSILKNNEQNIESSIKKDGSNLKFDIEKLQIFLETYDLGEDKINFAITNGNPYLTCILCYQALMNDIDFTITNQNVMNNLNNTLVKVFQNFNTKNLQIKNKITLNYIESYRQIYVFDDLARYRKLGELKYNVKYITAFSIDLYYSSDDFEDMIELAQDYCDSSIISLNIYKNAQPLEIKMRSYKDTSSKIIMILTRKEEEFIGLKKELDKKLIFINSNPFKCI